MTGYDSASKKHEVTFVDGDKHSFDLSTTMYQVPLPGTASEAATADAGTSSESKDTDHQQLVPNRRFSSIAISHAQLRGMRVEVCFANGQWHSGRVVNYDEATKENEVLFDDGESHRFDLASTRYRVPEAGEDRRFSGLEISYGQLQGMRVEVRFADGQWHGGIVTSYNEATGQNEVQFDDGESHSFDLSVTKYRVPESREPAGAVSSSPPLSPQHQASTTPATVSSKHRRYSTMNLGQGELVGKQVEVVFGAGDWYLGRVTSYDSASKKHEVTFVDGDKHTFDLSTTMYQVPLPETVAAAAAAGPAEQAAVGGGGGARVQRRFSSMAISHAQLQGMRIEVCFGDGQWHGGEVTSYDEASRENEVLFDDGESHGFDLTSTRYRVPDSMLGGGAGGLEGAGVASDLAPPSQAAAIVADVAAAANSLGRRFSTMNLGKEELVGKQVEVAFGAAGGGWYLGLVTNYDAVSEWHEART